MLIGYNIPVLFLKGALLMKSYNPNQKPQKRARHPFNVRSMALCALFAAITAVLSQLVIPIGPVPISMSTLAVLLAGGLLGARDGTISQLIYLLIGAVGVPVFSGFSGGLGKLASPTGGYIIGYIFMALVIGLLIPHCGNKLRYIIPTFALGLLVCYAFGTVWYIALTHTGIGAAMMACVVPFLPGDAVKIVLSALLTTKLYRHIQKIYGVGP